MRKISRFIGKIVLYFVLWSIASVLGYRFLPVHFTPLMGIRVMEQLVDGEKPKVSHRWVPYSQISDNMKRAVLASEDQRFFNHNGFDMVEIKKALKENKTRKRPRGASTISQQTAKNLFLWPRSSWLRKGLEAYFTVLIELFWSKERILTVYLNCIETGDGIYGVEAVAREHFDTTADKLTASQSALIAATLPNPLKYSSKNPSSYMKRRQSQILKQMRTVKLPPVAEKG
ncbi:MULTISPECIES: monofunctional biosynthetic peptidoglycan transglycosylase [Petrimonas]|mgnify:FL=1|jgi:monofunctional biosynthetic peptidoglycan transglycosylase|uniref:Biosynthetic peptidoglycan transglycosylase n=2 Tax=Petrimonas mucosa TaxID=1642646 RepID=A0A1G4G730_9BACT|nr:MULTISPECIES: monofunctional biosynthetic peptidoglycan transglycosylase [Petrimonas]MDD3561006.1 monofunctional biosynthetic peptidoglycan transglycosylase [Petrimonas mucosa]SCM57786.1 Monofunctional biosynthetic peptidoglycan transglycosylase {ECO:0000255/HAMAP-Rule:MF_00766} [Petrimonas mucosa]SFU48994.1 monofunctional biosynthetic peptidoglycan transglycosylase [Porphyromonadaceae bacterium KHP3R9]HHT29614.1 monofunctional biosynthetic peptidoglycan transglycosylase [Petrimonas mucosa]